MNYPASTKPLSTCANLCETARFRGGVCLGGRGSRMSAAPKPEKEEIKVFISHRDSICGECEESLGRKAWITLAGEKRALCLACADLDHLVFLPSGDAALTRRARKHSTLAAVVLKWSRARKRYERQALLVEAEGDPRGIPGADAECAAAPVPAAA